MKLNEPTCSIRSGAGIDLPARSPDAATINTTAVHGWSAGSDGQRH